MPTTNFHWDEVDDNVIMETTDNNVITQTYQHSPGRFGELISTRRGTTNWCYHYDGIGSTRKLTGDTQNITDTYIFDGFGNEVFQRGATTNPFRYKGEVGYYTNAATNDIYVRARTYQPVTGRWLSKDPLGTIDGPNLFAAYFAPGGFDASGLICCDKSKGRLCCQLTCYLDAPDDDLDKEDGCRRCCDGLLIAPGGHLVGSTRTPKVCCDEYRKRFPNLHAGGVVLCCDGNKVICANWFQHYGDPVADALIEACIAIHETEHLDAVRCRSCIPSLYHPDFIVLYDQNFEECGAYKAGINCLIDSLKKCSTDICRESILSRINKERDFANATYKCKNLPPPIV
jgi:RHS repeat-associated protein